MAKQAGSKKRNVRGSRTGRPIMALLDLLGQRWTLRILWELRDAPLTSRALRTACDEASPTVLQARLTELREDWPATSQCPHVMRGYLRTWRRKGYAQPPG